MRNGMKGRHYPYRIFKNGTRTRSKFLDVTRAAQKCVGLALSQPRGQVFEVVALPSMRTLALIQKSRRTLLTIKWHTRRSR